MFRCAIEVDMPAAVHVLGLLSGTPFFLRRHLVEETVGFARDIARKVNLRERRADVRNAEAA